jgi:hypothetical protein
MDNTELEKLIKQEMKDPSLDPQMIQTLLSSTMLAICETEEDLGEGGAEDSDEDGSAILATHALDDGTRYVTIFTSLKEMDLWAQGEGTGVPIDGWEAFSLAADDGIDLVVNPLGKHPLHFTSEDVVNILNEFGLTNIGEETLKIIGVVEDDPVLIKRILIEHFTKDENISEAYIALAQDAQTEQKVILVGMLPTGNEVDFDVLNVALNAAYDLLPDGYDLNFMIIDVADKDENSLSREMLHTGVKFFARS